MLLADGHSNLAIAAALFISERSVEFHITSIPATLTARDRAEAVLTALRYGIVKLAAGVAA